jgi:hypothetical protein
MSTGELSRRQFLGRSAAALGSVAGLGLADPLVALAKGKGGSGVPNPIPGGLGANFQPVPSDPVVHVLPPGIGFEMSTITDFNGVVGASEIRGTAHGSDGSSWDFDTDMRFMQGQYVDTSGRMQHGTFGFI